MEQKQINQSPDTVFSNGRLELRSEEVQEILTHTPSGVIRWGITLIFLGVLLLLFVSWIIKYPDVISSRVIITTQKPALGVVARATGKLILFVNENEQVEAGADLAAIENPANIKDAFALRETLEKLKLTFTAPDIPIEFDFNEGANLGEIEVDYSNFLQSYLDYQFFVQTSYHANKIQAIEKQIIFYQELNQKLVQQKEILVREVKLAQENYHNNQTLFEKKLVSRTELAKVESVYLQKKYALENAGASLINNKIQLAEYQKTIMELNQQFHEQKRRRILSLHEFYRKLQSQLAGWEQRYILKAPIAGRVSFFKFWSNNQFINTGDEVMAIVPDSHDLVGKIYLPASGSGKVKVGQKVIMKLDNYPFNQFGTVAGKVASISLVTRGNQYLINVNLSDGLKTNYGKTLEFKQAMQGTVEIVTDNLRILERIFNQLRYASANSISQ